MEEIKLAMLEAAASAGLPQRLFIVDTDMLFLAPPNAHFAGNLTRDCDLGMHVVPFSEGNFKINAGAMLHVNTPAMRSVWRGVIKRATAHSKRNGCLGGFNQWAIIDVTQATSSKIGSSLLHKSAESIVRWRLPDLPGHAGANLMGCGVRYDNHVTEPFVCRPPAGTAGCRSDTPVPCLESVLDQTTTLISTLHMKQNVHRGAEYAAMQLYGCLVAVTLADSSETGEVRGHIARYKRSILSDYHWVHGLPQHSFRHLDNGRLGEGASAADGKRKSAYHRDGSVPMLS